MRYPNSFKPAAAPMAAAPATLFRSGLYVAQNHATRTTQALTLNRLYFMPFRVMRNRALDRLAMEVTANVASAVIRVGIYADDPAYNFPGSLLFEAGSTIDAATGTGLVSVTINQTLTPGLWWLACCPQGAAPTVRASATPPESLPSTDPSGTAPAAALTQASVSGALPSLAAPASTTGVMPLMFIRAV